MRFIIVLPAAIALTLGSMALVNESDTAREAPRIQLVAAKATPKRHIAMRFALAQKGDPYRYGGTGPNSWDCSGLVMKAYGRANVSLPRTADAIMRSSKVQSISWKNARWGDLVFKLDSSGHAYHVEFYSSKTYKYGARHSGTRIGYSRWYGSVRLKHVKYAG